MSIARDTSRRVGLDLVGKIAAQCVAEVEAIEGLKGCDPTLYPQPVDLEPPFANLPAPSGAPPDKRWSLVSRQTPRRISDPVILKAWCPEDNNLDWQQCNDLHKELTVLSHPIAFEIIGNSQGIWLQIVVDRSDLAVIRTTVQAEFPNVRLEEMNQDGLVDWLNKPELFLGVEDFYPEPPYYRTMTVHEIIGGSPLAPVYVALSHLPASDLGFYRILSVPTDPRHDWHQRINQLTDLEYKGSNAEAYNPSIPHAYHQVPSLYLPMISEREEKKSHPDRPFYAVSIMTVALSPDATRPPEILRTVRTALCNFLYGTKPLKHLSKEAFLRCLPNEQSLRTMLLRREVHRPGMILNSLELCGPFHFPPKTILEDNEDTLHRAKGFEVPPQLQSGHLLVGFNEHLKHHTAVYVPEFLTNDHAYMIGKSGVGKSTLFENMILQEILNGRGVGLIEPHGDLTMSVLKRIPARRIPDVVFVDFQDNEYVACLNPFTVGPTEDRGRLADEFTCAFHDAIESWGPRMENILRQAAFVLFHIPGSTMADMGVLLSQTKEGDRFRGRIPEYVQNADALRFWRHVFPKYKAEALDPVTNKISKLMLNEKIAAVFSQRHGRIRWRTIMDAGQILLVRLSGLGPGNINFLGSLIIGGCKEAACSRSDLPPGQRRPFSLYIDEFHRFPTSSIEDLLVESRKFGVSIRLAHQETGQLDYPTRRAVGTADTVVAFCVDAEDASHLTKEFRNEIVEDDLLNLTVGQAYARINNEIVDLTTPPPPSEPGVNVVPQIIEHSRRQYYVHRSAASPADGSGGRQPTAPRVFATF